MTALTSWGRLTAAPHNSIPLSRSGEVAAVLATTAPGVAYGMGRSYGDACLNPGGNVWRTAAMDRFMSFDIRTGRLRCEAGVTLGDIQRLAIPKGWMLPVTPGTQWVTVGGAIANDVHGKNHHVRGSFGDHVRWLRLVRTDGEIIDCGPQLRPDWFRATVGGFGMTGVITEVELSLMPVPGPWLISANVPFQCLEDFFHLSSVSESQWEYTVAWIDCTSRNGERGIFMRANPTGDLTAAPRPARRACMPFVPPASLVNPVSLRAFNALYFHLKKRQAGVTYTHYEPFFYPLDGVRDWNRIYGPNGFYQYQAVLPSRTARDAVRAMVRETAKAGDGSFLAVLKVFGDRPAPGLMSFARPGVTLALDFPIRAAHTLRLFQRLDAIVHAARGRLYLAKDARMPPGMFIYGYPNLWEFLKYRDPGISSSLSRRLIGS